MKEALVVEVRIWTQFADPLVPRTARSPPQCGVEVTVHAHDHVARCNQEFRLDIPIEGCFGAASKDVSDSEKWSTSYLRKRLGMKGIAVQDCCNITEPDAFLMTGLSEKPVGVLRN